MNTCVFYISTHMNGIWAVWLQAFQVLFWLSVRVCVCLCILGFGFYAQQTHKSDGYKYEPTKWKGKKNMQILHKQKPKIKPNTILRIAQGNNNNARVPLCACAPHIFEIRNPNSTIGWIDGWIPFPCIFQTRPNSFFLWFNWVHRRANHQNAQKNEG